MIIACYECSTRYQLSENRIPEKGVRVRCPKCRYVWRLTKEQPEKREFQLGESGFESGIEISGNGVPGFDSEPMETAGSEEESVLDSQSGFTEIDIDETGPKQDVEPPRESPDIRKKKERAKRLARVFVSDILEYNREKRDKALAEGKLMSVLGPEIKKGWEGYKEKVGAEIKESSDYFREALNNILADGQKIF